MGGHGGLNILPQKSWHVYNQDNREKVARDEAEYEAEEKERRAKHRKAESEYRHAALLARVRGQPLDAAMPSGEPALLPDMDNTPPAQLSADSSPPVKHDIMAAKKAIQDPAGHFNFWRAEEMRDGNAEAKADGVQERRRRGKAETQTSDARFDERFKLGHAMAGKANTPWYAAGGSTLPTEELRALDVAQLLAASADMRGEAGGMAALTEGRLKKHKHKDKDSKGKKRHKEKGGKDAALKVGSQQLKASVAAMRAEREAREAAERAREKQLLRQTFRG